MTTSLTLYCRVMPAESATLNNRLRLWRAEAGLTLEEVADLTGVSAAMLSRAERAEREMAPLTRVEQRAARGGR